MRFGFHVSIAGGFRNAVAQARERKCETIQVFSRNPQGWALKALDPDDVTQFRQGIRELDICPVVVHLPYLPNLAAEDDTHWAKSIAALRIDLERAAAIGAHYVVAHMGCRKDNPEDAALARMIRGIDEAMTGTMTNDQAPSLGRKSQCPNPNIQSSTNDQAPMTKGRIPDSAISVHQRSSAVSSSGSSIPHSAIRIPQFGGPRLLLENTAGMGKSLGYRFEHIQTVISGVRNPNRLGMVLDTAHAFEAGYELRTPDGLNRALRELDATVGLKYLCLLHLNDSKTAFNSRVDRHWHIGKGEIGREGFRLIVNHPLLRHLPGIMETPRLSLKEDRMNLRAVRRLVK